MVLNGNVVLANCENYGKGNLYEFIKDDDRKSLTKKIGITGTSKLYLCEVQYNLIC